MKDWVSTFNEPSENLPTRHMADGPLLGNGDLGVVLGGPADNLQLWISKNDFWRAAERIVDGSRFGRTMGAPCCITKLGLRIDRSDIRHYRVDQDIRNAELRGQFRTHEGDDVAFRAWVPATENLLVVELTCSGDGWLDIELETTTSRLASMESGYDEHGSIWLRRSFREGVEWPTEAAVFMRRLDAGEAPGWHHKSLQAGKTAVFVLAVRTNHDSGDTFVDDARERAAQLTVADIEGLREEHRAWWADFWSRSSIDIGDDLIEKGWYGAHYIMACCSRNKEFPPGLFGNWITTDEPFWAGDYHLNYNFQAAWWGVFSSNHIELADPYDAPMMAFIPRGRENAKKHLGCRGIYYEVGLGPRGMSTADLFHGQKSNSAYVAINMIMRFRYTCDLDYARSVAYPFLREVADFWEDYLTFEDGRYVIYKDAIHEGFEEHSDFNSILSLGLIRAALKALLDITEELELDAGRREKWQHMLDNLSPFPTCEHDGATVFRLTEQGPDWADANTLALQHVFPGGCVGLDSDPHLLQVARNTIAKKAVWKDGNGFPTFYPAAARVGHDPNEILEQLHRLLETEMFRSLLVFQWGGGVETCGGITAAINEMLLQSHEGVIRLFPVWPPDRPAQFETLRAEGAFVVSAQFRDGAVVSATITSDKGRPCTVQNPWPGSEPAVAEAKDGENIPVPVQVNGDRLTFATRPGGRYVLGR